MFSKVQEQCQDDHQSKSGHSNNHPQHSPDKEVLLKVLSPQKEAYIIQFTNDNSKLTIKRGVLVIKKLKQSKIEIIERQKNNKLNAKIHSKNQEDQAITSNTKKKSSDDDLTQQEQIFFIQENIVKLKNGCKEIIIETSRVNIYALKELVRIASHHLVKLKINNCTFYESDSSTMQDRKQSSNNKMLRELSFTFQIKALQLPQIECIDITLLKKENQNSNTLKQSKTLQEAAIEKDQLVKQFKCHPQSYFIDFELNIKPIIEEKYQKKYQSQDEVVNHIINGNSQEKSHLEDCINENIIKDINEHLIVFKQYIKGALFKNKCNILLFIIREYCLEDPIAFNMLCNSIIKNKSKIKTVIFKETGTIPYECFQKIIHQLQSIKYLESIAFFDAQPQQDLKSYALFQEIADMKSFKYIILHRSSFDITQHRLQRTIKEKPIPMQTGNEQIPIGASIPKYYGFYILSTDELYEFTPYENSVKEILFQDKTFASEAEYQEQLQNYNIYHLINNQQQEYPQGIKYEIKKYQEVQLLTFQNISEQIIIKYPTIIDFHKTFHEKKKVDVPVMKTKKKTKNQRKNRRLMQEDGDSEGGDDNQRQALNKPKGNEQGDFDQKELERDIRLLIKHSNYYSTNKAMLMIEKLKDPTLQSFLKKECIPYLKYEPKRLFKSQPQLDYILLKEQYLFPCILSGCLIQDEYISLGYSQFKISTETEQIVEASQIIYNINQFDKELIIQKIENENEMIRGIEFNFLMKEFFVQLVNLQGHKINYQIIMEQKEYFRNYQNSEFQQKIIDIIYRCYEKNIDIYYQLENYTWRTQSMILQKLDKNIKLKAMYIYSNITGHYDPFYFFYLGSVLKIEQLYLKNLEVQVESKNAECDIKTIIFENCSLNSFEVSCIVRNLKQVKLDRCSGAEQFIQSFMTYKLTPNEQCILSSNYNIRKSIHAIFDRKGLDDVSISYLSVEVLSRFYSNLNQQLLNRFYQYDSISLYGVETPDKRSNSNKDKHRKYISQDFKNSQKEKKRQINIQAICQHAIKLYLLNSQWDQLTVIARSNTTQKYESQSRDLLQNIPECCRSSLSINDTYTALSQHSTLMDALNYHQGDFCLFKTSIFQSRSMPRRVQIKFNQNLLIDLPQIQDYKAMESIEKLDFSNSILSDPFQVKFLDLIIQLCPTIKSLKLKNIIVNIPIENGGHILLSPLINHTNLRKLVMSFPKQRCIMSLLIEVNQSSHIKLKVFKLACPAANTPDMKQILEQNKDNIHILHLSLHSEEIYKAIMECNKLKKLGLEIQPGLENEMFTFNNFEQLKQLKEIEEITIYQNCETIELEFLKSILRISEYSSPFLSKINFRTLPISFQISSSMKIYCHCAQAQINRVHHIVIIQMSKDFEVIISGNQEKMKLIDFISSYDQSIKLLYDDDSSTIDNLLILLSSPGMERLQELYFNKKLHDFSFLNAIFQITQESLKVLQFFNCELTEKSFNCVDFSKLPTSIKYLDFQYNVELNFLSFLEPLLDQSISKKYQQNMVLCLDNTGITIFEAIKYIPYVKKIFNSDYQELIDFYSHIEFKYNYDLEYQQNLANFILSNIRETISDLLKFTNFSFLDDFYLNLLYKNFFYEKIFSTTNRSQMYPFILSPLQVICNQINFTSTDLMQIYNRQKQDCRFSLRQQLGNKYLLINTLLLNQNHKFILGYSKNFHNPNFNIQKRLKEQTKKDEKKTDLQENEHFFYDYLLLLQIQDRQNLKQIHLPFNLEVIPELLSNRKIDTNIDEITMIEYLSRIPPSEIVIDSMSISFIKTWYVINTISPLVFKTTIQNYQYKKVYNSSIGNFLTQNLDKNNFLKNILRSTPSTYRYDDTVYLLAQHFDELIQQNKHSYLLSLYPLYLFFCIFGVVYFSLHFNITCGQGISWYSYYSYFIYGFTTFWIELWLFKKCLNYISHLIPSIEINLNPNFLISFVNKIKQSIIDTPWINQWYLGYSYSFVQSQIARFDNFTNVGFLYSTYECGDYVIFYTALSFMVIPFLYQLYQSFKLALRPQKKYPLPTASLDEFYTICNVIEFRAVSDILDLVSPSNIISIKGRMYNARIISYLICIICESIPLVVIQIYNLTKKSMTSSLVLSLLLSIITFLSLLISVLTITPSTLSQEDFNKLNEKKRKYKTVEAYEERLSTFEEETFTLRFYEHLKQIRFKYLNENQQGNVRLELTHQSNANRRYFKQLFDSPIESPSNEEQKETC